MPDFPDDVRGVDPEPVPVAVRVQILATEHWNLLATRSMIWNEIFSRTGTFLTTLSAAAVALALVAQATNFGQDFYVFALLVLPVVLLLGTGTFLRLQTVLEEDVWLVLGMNRLRRAYLDISPDLERYFITSGHDDLPGFMQTYSAYGRPAEPGIGPGRVLSSTAAIVGILDCVLIGIVAALLVHIVEDRLAVYVTAGAITGLVAAVIVLGVLPYRSITGMMRKYEPRFPR